MWSGFRKPAMAAMVAIVAALGIAAAPPLAPPQPLGPSAAPSAKTSIVAVPATGQQGAAALTKTDLDAWLDGFMPNSLRAGDVAGAVVVVVKDGQMLTQRGFGYADLAKRTPVDPERTLFRPGSVAKLFTWTAVMQQVEEGRIDLDADVNKYIDFKIPAWNGKPATMRQLMTHSAGFEDHAKFIMFHDPKYLRPLDVYLKDWIPNRIYEPGTTPSYSNYSTALAGYIVQRVSGVPLETYIERRIFAPLGMTGSTVRQPLPARFASRMALGYPRASVPPSPYELVGPWPAGSLASTGADMGRFMIAHLQNGAFGSDRILRAETAQLMHDSPTTIVPPLNRMELGFFETNINGRDVTTHMGDTQTFHTSLHLFRKENVGLYISMNSTGKDGAAGAIRSALFEDFADRYFPSIAPPDGRVDPKAAAEHARMMVGNWQSSRRVETGFMRMLGLMGQTKITVDEKGQLTVPALTGPGGGVRQWVEIAPFVWRDRDSHERLAAKLVDGKVVRWSIDGVSPFMVFDRVPASRSSSWIMPLFYLSLVILLLAFLHWPVAALVRRHYKSPLPAEGRARLVYRGVRLASGLVLAVFAGWMAALAMMADISFLTPKADALLWSLQIAGLIVFVGAALLAAWNARLAFRDRRRWTGKVAALLILLATLFILWLAFTFGLIALSVDF